MTTTLLAIPAKPGVQTVEQPDGTTLRITLHGDEYFHFTTTEDGYLIRQNANGVYEYAEFTAGKVMKPIGVKAYSIDQRAVIGQQLPKRAMKAAEAFQQNLPTKVTNQRKNAPTIQRAPGVVNLPPRGLVLLIEYADTKLQTESTQAAISDMLNSSDYTYDGATGSVQKYFSDQSNGLYVPEFDVVGPITLSRDMAYYGQNTIDAKGSNDLRADEMINEACSIANATLDVDFSKYDADNDGNVDFVFAIYAGYSEAHGASEEAIWPHQGNLSSIASSKRYYDGKYVLTYACSSELFGTSGTTRNGIGTFCHEFSHVLGLADYYDTDYEEGIDNTYREPALWSLMSGGGNNNDGKTPPNYSAFDKYSLGWATPIILNAPSNLTLEADGTTYYAVTADGTLSNATEEKDVWYLENRQQTGWDAYLPAHGMLITKVHYNNSAWTDNTVNNGNPLCYEIIDADGMAASHSSSGITFPGARNTRSVRLVDKYHISNITETSGIIRFDFMGEYNGKHPMIFLDTFEDDHEWIITDNSETAALTMYLGGYMGWLPAVYGKLYLISGEDFFAPRDAWAIMRHGILLKAGEEYAISAYVYAPGGDVIDQITDQIQFTVGTSSEISSQTTIIHDMQEKYDSWMLVTAKFTPVTDGIYYFGIHHCTQEPGGGTIAIDDFLITAMDGEPEEISVMNIILEEASLALEVGDTHTLAAKIVPLNATNPNYTWSSSAENIVSVDNTGKLTALAAGTATITVTTEEGGKTATCEVTVSNLKIFEVPFYDSFEDDSTWILIDSSSTAGIGIGAFPDMPAAGGEAYFISGYDELAPRDAWAIMQNGVSLKAGEKYTISAYVLAPGNNVADQIQFTVGNSRDVSSQTTVILDLHEAYYSWTVVTANFTPVTDGVYYFGIHHCTQDIGVNIIAIDEFSIVVATPDSNDPETREVPFHDSFESDSDWIITDNSTTVAFNMQINKIADIATVSGNYYLVSGYDPSAARNAWAIMRNGLSLKAGQEYTVSAYVFAPGYSVAEQIQFTVGASSAISNQTDVILNLHEKYESWTLVKAHFIPATDGTYYFGIHHCTPNVDVNAIAVDDFTIVEKDDTALKNVESYTSSARKVLENGTIYIIRPNGNKYTVDGIRVE